MAKRHKVKAKLYNPREIEHLGSMPEGMKEMRRAYSELRKIANKRIKRLEQAGLLTHRQNNMLFPTLDKIWSMDLPEQLAEVSRYIRTSETMVSVAKKRRESSLKYLREERGFTFINESNYNMYLKFMEEMREKYGGKAFDSGDATDAFNESIRLGVPVEELKEHFEEFVTNQQKIERLKPKRDGSTQTYEDIKSKLKRLKEV